MTEYSSAIKAMNISLADAYYLRKKQEFLLNRAEADAEQHAKNSEAASILIDQLIDAIIKIGGEPCSDPDSPIIEDPKKRTYGHIIS